MTSTPHILSLLISLPFSHPSFSPLLVSHRPFAYPSHLPQQPLSKLLTRLNTVFLSRDDNTERRSALEIAKEIVEQDQEGWVMTNWGKGWVGACLGQVASTSNPILTLPSHLSFLSTVVLASSRYPSFEREVVHPIMGKLSVSLLKLIDRTLLDPNPEWEVLLHLLETIKAILAHSPANFRPSIPTLKPNLLNLILRLPTPSRPIHHTVPFEIRQIAAELVASLHLTAGKAQSPASWGSEMKEALGGVGRALGGIVGDAWEEEPVRINPPVAPSGLPDLPLDPITRLPISLDWLEGYVEVIRSLLRFPTGRPVPVPIAQITVSYISPHHHAALLAALPRIWISGAQLLGGVALACGDHLIPHVGTIFDHTVWLSERLPNTMAESQIQLLKFHRLLLTLYPSSLVSVEYPTRLLRLCLTKLSPLLDSRSKPVNIGSQANGGGKRGKKRARGAEDSLVGDLEGREGRAVGVNECAVALEALKLMSLLHPTPLLSPSLLTFSIRLHLSLYLTLLSLPGTAFASPSSCGELQNGVEEVLEEAVLMVEGEGGTARGWKSLVISVLSHKNGKIAPILHPSLPPLMRSLPPLSQLHFFAKEGEAEKKERLGMGFGSLDDGEEAQEQERRDVVDQNSIRAHFATLSAVPSSSTSTNGGSIFTPIAPREPTTTTPVIVPVTVAVTAAPASAPAATTPSIVAPVPTQAPALAPVPPEADPVEAHQTSVSSTYESTFISVSHSTNISTAAKSNVSRGMGGLEIDSDDEGIPELDSGSDDDESDEDEDEDEEDDD
ncbi:hypothetical protein IAR55_005937 [Kwoniella newhampshirensis]|uniref:Pre-rRNA-processing protein RIX1 n=1 Tax=Kwoniella newhampshirensis TaxID=1651941 RepID=A0AAW0YHN8_9TREE